VKAGRTTESGQIMVLIALAIVAMLGFAALAIDVGMVYADRRAEQNAADSAALAGMQTAMETVKTLIKYDDFSCNTNTSWVTSISDAVLVTPKPAWLTQAVLDKILNKAISMAQKNGFTIDPGLTANNGVAFRCSTNSARSIEVRVKITSPTKSSFLQLFGRGELVNTVEAIGIGKPSQPALSGISLYILDNDCTSGGISFTGGGNADPTVSITNGGKAFSRSCIDGNNGSHNFLAASAINCLAHPGNPYACGITGGFSPPATYTNEDPLTGILIGSDLNATCNDWKSTKIKSAANLDILTPGYYTSVGNATHLLPGLYCLDMNSGFNRYLTSIAGTVDGKTYSMGVTIVLMQVSHFGGTGNYNWDLKAYNPSEPTNNGPIGIGAVQGLVIYSTKVVSLSFGGNAQAEFWGTVYLPAGSVELGGTADVNGTPKSISMQIIAKSFNSHGNTTLKMRYNPDSFIQTPPSLSLIK
jgi:Flp pilus assembly protein TadG